MSQKYKFFINDHCVVISRGAASTMDWSHPDSRDEWMVEVDEAAQLIQKLKLERDVFIEAWDPEGAMHRLKSQFRTIHAAGGYVLNEKLQLLVIHRRGSWDLPKGKLDPGETLEQCAMREVEEECGLGGLSVIPPPFSTHHFYLEKGEVVLKESHWFAMRVEGEPELNPQRDEDIELARWTDLPVGHQIYSGAYRSVRDVLDHFGGTIGGGGSSETSGG